MAILFTVHTTLPSSSGIRESTDHRPQSVATARQLGLFVDQSGNPLDDGTPIFLSPEWGCVSPFAMTEDEIEWKKRDDYWYQYTMTPALLH